jgi:hypothetical protein
VLLPALAAYDIKVESKGLQAYSGTFSMDSLRVYASGPLIIEMGKEIIECVGGSYPWDVLLESQTDVANFALRCHTQINGNLILQDSFQDDPIVDLTPLSELRIIGKSLEISNNSQLESLEGLQNLSAVYGQVTVKGKGKLKTLTGFKGINTIESKLSITKILPWSIWMGYKG